MPVKVKILRDFKKQMTTTLNKSCKTDAKDDAKKDGAADATALGAAKIIHDAIEQKQKEVEALKDQLEKDAKAKEPPGTVDAITVAKEARKAGGPLAVSGAKFDVASDLLDAKEPKCVLVGKERGESACVKVSQHSYYTDNHKKWCKELMDEQALTFTGFPIGKKPMVKLIVALLKTLGADVGPVSPPPDKLEKMMTPVFVCARPGASLAQTGTDNMLVQATLVLEGALTFWCVPLASLEGDTSSKKVEAVKGMNRAQFEQLVKQTGFFVSAEEGQTILLPPNYYCITANLDGCEEAHALRWHLLGAENTMRYTKSCLEKSLKESGAKNPTSAQHDLQKYLELHVPSVA